MRAQDQPRKRSTSTPAQGAAADSLAKSIIDLTELEAPPATSPAALDVDRVMTSAPKDPSYWLG